jgi:hypothetical protein
MHVDGEPDLHSGTAFHGACAKAALTGEVHAAAMRSLLIGLLLFVLALPRVAAQPADCQSEPATGPKLPLSLDLAGRPGVPRGVTGQAYVEVPIGAPGIACQDAPPPPSDILRGEPGNLLGPSSPDLLRGPGTPRVRIETR